MQSWSYDAANPAHLSWGAEDSFVVHNELERGAPCCANPACALHVRLIDLQAQGGGNWISLPDGRVFGRTRLGEQLLCDACGTHRGPVRINPS